MSAQKLAFFAFSGASAAMLFAFIALIAGAGYNYFTGNPINLNPVLFAFWGLFFAQTVLAYWLRWLGGAPEEYKKK